MKLLEKLGVPLGMVAVVVYFAHTILGRILWKEYNPITTDISSLTAIGAPNRNLLLIFTTIYGILMILFAIAMVIKARRGMSKLVLCGWILFLVQEMVSFFGYTLFPLEGDKTVMTFSNMMHIVVTFIVVFSSISSIFFLAAGYIKQTKDRRLGIFTLIMAITITAFGIIIPIGMACGWNVLGLTERMEIYSSQLFIFVFSYHYTFGEHTNPKLEHAKIV